MKGKPIILAVDDKEESLGFFRKILKRQDYMVLTADNGKEALEVVDRKRPDLVILNLRPSGMNEIEILRQIKRVDENMEVIIITGYGTMKTARTAMELGAYDYITRPFDNDYIMALIKNLFSPVSENVLELKLR